MLACKAEKTNDEADDFLATFGGVSFDALVEGSGPNAACSRMEQEFELTLENLAENLADEEFELRLENLAENLADDGQDVEEHAAEVLPAEVPPWRLIPAATGTEAPPDPRRRMQTPKPLKPCPKAHADSQAPGSSSSHGRHRASEEVRCRPESGPSGFNYGPGTGEDSMHEGQTQRFFENGHLVFLMIDLHSRMRRFLNL